MSKNGAEFDEIQLLQFNVNVLRLIGLWPESKSKILSASFLRFFVLTVVFWPSAFPIVYDMIYQLIGNMEDLSGVTENFAGLLPWIGMHYMAACFMNNLQKMKAIVKFIREKFHHFQDTKEKLMETEDRSIFYTKFFLCYGILGNICYAIIPLLQKPYCEKHQPLAFCMITRTRLPFNLFERYQLSYYIMFFFQFYTCVVISIIVLALTTFLNSILIYLVSQIEHLKQKLIIVCEEGVPFEDMKERLGYCIQYHQTIIECAMLMRQAFKSMMLVHMTLTSVALSVLGFEILMVKTVADSIRFAMHLGGWLFILGLPCYYGQKLHDESLEVGDKIYESDWFTCNPKLRKDIKFIIMRSQLPLTLNAASVGHMSLETFLRVMSSAYSYFTLLINLKTK